MRSVIFGRSNVNVFLSIFYTAICQFVYRFKFLCTALRSEFRFFISHLADWIAQLPELSDIARQLFTWQTLRAVIPNVKTIVICLITFGLILPYLATSLNNTLYKDLFDSSSYRDLSTTLHQITRGANLTEQIVRENTERLTKAIGVLDRLMVDFSNITTDIRRKEFKDVVIGIITYSRDKYRESWDKDPRQYLTQLTASLIDKYRQYREVRDVYGVGGPFRTRGLNIGLMLCNVDENPDSHHEYRWLSNRLKVPSTTRKDKEKYLNSCDDPEKKVTGMGPWGPFEYNSNYEKQKQDYTYCLKYFQEQMLSRFVLVLEDDVLPAKDFFFRLHELVINRLDRYEYGAQVSEHHHDSFYGRPPFFMIKLHHPEVFMSFLNQSPERIIQLLAMGTIGSIVTVFLCRAIPTVWNIVNVKRAKKSSCRTSPEPMTRNTSDAEDNSVPLNFDLHCSPWFYFADQVFSSRPFDWFNFAKWLIFFTLVFLSLGRPNAYIPLLQILSESLTRFPYYFMTFVPAPSCCMTAVLYPRASVDEVIRFFDENRCIQNSEARDDMLFGQLSETHRLPSVLTEPNLFHHIGRYSSIRGRVNTNDDREWAGIPF